MNEKIIKETTKVPVLTSISRICLEAVAPISWLTISLSDSIFMQLIGSVDAPSARSLCLRRIGSPLFHFFFFSRFFLFCSFTVSSVCSNRTRQRYPRLFRFEHHGASSSPRVLSRWKKENALGQTKQNKPKRSNLFSDPSFPSKYYQVTYTCPTYQNLTYPESTTMHHINVSMNV